MLNEKLNRLTERVDLIADNSEAVAEKSTKLIDLLTKSLEAMQEERNNFGNKFMIIFEKHTEMIRIIHACTAFLKIQEKEINELRHIVHGLDPKS